MKRLMVAGILTLAAAGLHAQEKKGEVRRPGRYLVEYKDDSLQVLLGLRFASARPAGQWLMIETFMTATGNTPVRIDREDIALVVPGGTRVQLASQKALAEGIPDVRKMYTEASITRDPMEGYFVGPSRVERLGFFAPPTEKIVFDRVTLERTTLSEGYLFFHAPGDKFPPGRYVLEVFNKDVDVKLPFTLPAAPLDGKKDDKDKTVTW